MPKVLMKSIGLMIALVGLLSIKRAGQFAFILFSTAPRRRPASDKERAILMRAAPRLAAVEQVRLVISDCVVSVFRFNAAAAASKGRVLVVHGYQSRTEHMLAIVDRLTGAGLEVVAIDLPGHGHSSGRRSHLLNAVEAIDAAWRQFDGFDAMIGHSFGGAAVIVAATGSMPGIRQRKPYKLVTIAAPTRLSAVFDWYARKIGLNREIRTAFEGQVLKLTGKPLSAFDTATDLQRTRIETLVFHAPDDKEVAFSNAERLAAAGPNVRLFPVPDFGHRRILSALPMLDELVAFLVSADTGQYPAIVQKSARPARPENAAEAGARRSA